MCIRDSYSSKLFITLSVQGNEAVTSQPIHFQLCGVDVCVLEQKSSHLQSRQSFFSLETVESSLHFITCLLYLLHAPFVLLTYYLIYLTRILSILVMG